MDDLISRQWLMECVDEGWIKFDTEKDKNRYIHLVRDIAPSVQPQYEEITPEEAASEIASGSIMSASYWLDLMIRLKQMGYAICRKKGREMM